MINQNTFEFALYKCLTYGDEKRIAEKAGKGSSYYAQMFNPDDPRESLFYRAARDFANWAEVNQEDAAKAFAEFCAFVSPFMHTGQDLCHDTEIGNTLTEVNDIAMIRIKGGSFYEQLRETVEAEIQVAKLKSAVLDKIHAEKSQANGGTTRYNGNGILTPEIKAEARRRKG